ncbi:MAG TPA: ABC transporter permease [Bryobacteraceae bacterium]|jgi:predicted permease|nr:ABC transporter permease [Bryobacteraceae bacterium]
MPNDLRFAVRMLRKNPGFVAVAVCSLAIGIGANSAIYSFASAVMLRPLPVPKPSRVVTVSAVSAHAFWASNDLSYPDYVDFRDHNRTFEGLVGSSYGSFGFAPDKVTQPRRKFGMFVSGNFFSTLKVQPAAGRNFRTEEDRVPGRDAVVILSHELWVSDFGGNPSAIGQKLWLNGIEFTVVGVAPAAFEALEQVKPALFVPIAMSAGLGENNLDKRDVRWVTVRGRLRPGFNMAQAQADLGAITNSLRSSYPKTDSDLQVKVQTELQVRTERSPPDTALLIMLIALALCVLAVACANVASLLLSRATVRAREIGVRLAIGASRASLIRQLLLENLLLALAGGAAGLLIAYGATKFFNTLPIPTDVPLSLHVELDNSALLFTLAVAIVSTFLFGLTPAFRTTRLDLTRSLKDKDGAGQRQGRLWGRKLIVAGQVALSLVLLLVSGALVAGFRSQLNQGPGFRTERLQLMAFDPALVRYNDAQRDVFYRQLLDRVRILPAVKSAALSSSIPMSMSMLNSIGVVPDGYHLKKGENAVDTFDSVITPDYFGAMAIPLVRGRLFQDSDKKDTTPVAIVNEQFVKHYWPNQNPIGKRIRLKDSSGRTVEIVGVARDSKYLWISESPMDFVYLPFSQNSQSNMALIAESRAADPATLIPVLRETTQSIDRNMPLFEVRTMKSLYESRAVATPNIITETVAAMGLMGLILSVIGLYGVVSYSVSRRSREFGIRMAIGAGRNQVVSLVLRQGLFLSLAGLAAGLVVGVLALKAILSTMLFSFHVGTSPFIIVALLLLVTTTLAAYGPARRASRIDPMRALREE